VRLRGAPSHPASDNEKRGDRTTGRGVALLVLWPVLAACEDPDAGPKPSDQPLVFDAIAVSPEEQEEFARKFTPCSVPEMDTSGWRSWGLDVGVRVRLPQEYVRQETGLPDQFAWEAPDTTLLLIVVHAGDGQASTGIGFDDEPEAWEDESLCSIRIAGRTAVLFMHRSRYGGRWFHYATVDWGVREGFGLGSAILTANAERRGELLAALSTLQIRE
jgi:hypothetical protein